GGPHQLVELRSERKLHTELNLARQPSEGGLAEITVRDVCTKPVELRVVPEVVRLNADLQGSTFLRFWKRDTCKVLKHGEVVVVDALSADVVAGAVPERAGCVRAEGGDIEPLGLGARPRVGVAKHIGAVSAAAAMGDIARLRDGVRKCARQSGYS